MITIIKISKWSLYVSLYNVGYFYLFIYLFFEVELCGEMRIELPNNEAAEVDNLRDKNFK